MTQLEHDLSHAWRNDAARRAWLEAYRDWGKWFDTPEFDLRWYKFDLPGGERLIACEHTSSFHGEPTADYYWLSPGEQLRPRFPQGVSIIAERLTATKKQFTD